MMRWGFRRRKGQKPAPPKSKKRVYCGECEYYRKTENKWYVYGMTDEQYRYDLHCDAPQNHFPRRNEHRTFEKVEVSEWIHKENPRLWNRENDCKWFKQRIGEGCWEV